MFRGIREVLDGAGEREAVRRDDALVGVGADERGRIEVLRIDHRGVHVREDPELVGHANVVAVGGHAVRDHALAHLALLEGIDHAHLTRHARDPAVVLDRHQSPPVVPSPPGAGAASAGAPGAGASCAAASAARRASSSLFLRLRDLRRAHGQEALHGLRDAVDELHAHADLTLAGHRADVRQQQRARVRAQAIDRLARGLRGVGVERRAGQVAALEEIGERLLVHEAAPPEVEQVGTALHRLEALAVHQILRVVVERQVEASRSRTSGEPPRASAGGRRRRCSRSRTGRARSRASRRPAPAWRRRGRSGRARSGRAAYP